MEQKIYLKEKSFKRVLSKSGEQFRLVFLKTFVLLLITFFVVIAVKAQTPATPIQFDKNGNVKNYKQGIQTNTIRDLQRNSN
jgi:hypothetical protein